MPSLDDEILDCVVYLYPSIEDAENGIDAGGTGFLLSIYPEAEDLEEWEHLYAVSNAHVAGDGPEQGHSPVMRLTTLSGEPDVLPLGFEHWLPHPTGADLAVHYFGLVKNDIFLFRSINSEMLLTKEKMRSLNVGPGDDVFMVGRFFLQEGKQRNTPSVRFGNISMMPWEPVQHPSGIDQESFLVELRTISGYSGSPVFLHHPYTPPPPKLIGGAGKMYTRLYGTQGARHKTRLSNAYLLGVDWGHVAFKESVFLKIERSGETEYDPTNFVADSHSGQSGVVPAWVLHDFLHSKGLDEMRKQAEQSKKEKKKSHFVLDVKRPKESAFTKSTFEEALKKASQKVSEPESKDSETSE